MEKPSFTLTSDNIAVALKGEVYNVRRGSPNFEGLKRALYEEDWNSVPGYLTVAKSIEAWSRGDFKVVGSEVRLKDVALPSELSQRIVAMVTRNEDPSSLLNFWERLQKNPSFRSVKQLWSFLNQKNIPLTPDGFFLAYKSVKSNYKDHHTGTVDNKIGVINEMPRNQISDDPNMACHEGYHVGAIGYAQSFGSDDRRIVICKIDPADVVCVPYDSSQQKMRVCKYEVVGHYGSDLPSTVYQHEAKAPPIPQDSDEDEVIEEDVNLDDDDIEDSEAEEDDEEDDEEDESEDEEDEDDEEPVKAAKKAQKPAVKSKAHQKAQKPAPNKTAPKGSPWAKFDKMDEDKLLEQSLDDLRKYAANGLQIFGASKIPGGKLALVARILEVRE